MPWTNKGGNGGGPWGGGGDGNGSTGGSGGGSGGGGGGGPWGTPGGRPGGGGPPVPDLEEILRRGQQRLKGIVPPGGGGRGWILLAILVVAGWGLSGFYRVEPDEQGVVLRFGRWVRDADPGLNYHLPYPIEEALTPKVTRTNRVDIGYRSGGTDSEAARDVPEESLMLTEDQNIVDVNFTVYWRIKDAGLYLFQVRAPDETVKVAAESAMRGVVGQTRILQIFTVGRQLIEQRTQQDLQRILDGYHAGISVENVQLLRVDPPAPVIDAFNDVQRAKQDKDRLQNEAQAYANDVIPRARGDASRILQEAKAYQGQVVAAATGDAKRFLEVYEAYQKAPDVTRRRLYLETMEEVLAKVNKVVLERAAANQGVVPYLPLPALPARERKP